jgi:hypothetical protein
MSLPLLPSADYLLIRLSQISGLRRYRSSSSEHATRSWRGQGRPAVRRMAMANRPGL